MRRVTRSCTRDIAGRVQRDKVAEDGSGQAAGLSGPHTWWAVRELSRHGCQHCGKRKHQAQPAPCEHWLQKSREQHRSSLIHAANYRLHHDTSFTPPNAAGGVADETGGAPSTSAKLSSMPAEGVDDGDQPAAKVTKLQDEGNPGACSHACLFVRVSGWCHDGRPAVVGTPWQRLQAEISCEASKSF
jgi:hypothetical protein